MQARILTGREHETIEAKTRWFKSLSMEERMRVIAETTSFVVALNPQLLKKPYAGPTCPGVQVIKDA